MAEFIFLLILHITVNKHGTVFLEGHFIGKKVIFDKKKRKKKLEMRKITRGI